MPIVGMTPIQMGLPPARSAASAAVVLVVALAQVWIQLVPPQSTETLNYGGPAWLLRVDV